MENYLFHQRRSTKRTKLSGPVRFQCKDPEQYGFCLACDVSEGGLKLHLNQFVPLKEELEIAVQLKNEKAIVCRAKVVWIEQDRYAERYKAGLQFLQSGEYFNSKKEIGAFVGGT